MEETVDNPFVEPSPTTKPRFNVRKALKVAAITTAVVSVAVIAKRKLSGNVDGEVTATVSTDTDS